MSKQNVVFINNSAPNCLNYSERESQISAYVLRVKVMRNGIYMEMEHSRQMVKIYQRAPLLIIKKTIKLGDIIEVENELFMTFGIQFGMLQMVRIGMLDLYLLEL